MPLLLSQHVTPVRKDMEYCNTVIQRTRIASQNRRCRTTCVYTAIIEENGLHLNENDNKSGEDEWRDSNIKDGEGAVTKKESDNGRGLSKRQYWQNTETD